MVILTAVVVGCAPVTRSNWEPTAWHVQENKSSVPEIGRLQNGQFEYDIVVTDLRKVIKIYDPVLQLPEVTKHPKTMIAIAVRCRNRSNGTLNIKCRSDSNDRCIQNTREKIDPRRSNIQTLWWKDARGIPIRNA